MNLIAAVDKNWAIGCKNKLLVSIPADMKFFRETTTGKVVVMGRKTLESFPNGQPLKKRVNIVLTHDKNFKAGDAIIVHSMEELREIGICLKCIVDLCDMRHITVIEKLFINGLSTDHINILTWIFL